MKTNQVMQSIDRELFGIIVRQRTKDSYFALKDIMAVGNKWRIENGIHEPLRQERYFALDSTKNFIEALREIKQCDPYIKARGRGTESWIHPHIMIDILLWVNPHFKVQVYDWLMDYLIKYRIDSGDSYTKMCGVLAQYSSRKEKLQADIKKLAGMIKEKIGVDDWNQATQQQLKDRDYLQNLISDLSYTFKSSKKGVYLAFQAFSSQRGEK